MATKKARDGTGICPIGLWCLRFRPPSWARVGGLRKILGRWEQQKTMGSVDLFGEYRQNILEYLAQEYSWWLVKVCKNQIMEDLKIIENRRTCQVIILFQLSAWHLQMWILNSPWISPWRSGLKKVWVASSHCRSALKHIIFIWLYHAL